MILSLVSKLCWSVRHVSLVVINLTKGVAFQNEYWAPFLHYSVLGMVVFLPVMGVLLWCCLALDEWMMEEDSRGYLRRALHEAEEARRREESERRERKER